MGCTSSVSPDPPPNPAAKTDSRPDIKPEKPREELTKQGSSVRTGEPALVSVQIRDSSSHVSVQPEEDQDLYVAPLTPRKKKELEQWVDAITVHLPQQEDDLMRPHTGRRNSDVDSIRTDATGATAGTVPEVTERKSSENPTSTLTHENVKNHTSMLSHKDGRPRPFVQALTPLAGSMSADMGDQSQIFSTTFSVNQRLGTGEHSHNNVHSAEPSPRTHVV